MTRKKTTEAPPAAADSTAMTQTGTAAEPVGTQLITLDPEKYVVAVFATFKDRLDKAKEEAAAIATVDATTPAGMKVAVAHRAVFRSIRIEAEAARKARKQPILEIGKLLDSRYKEIATEVSKEEDRFDAAIKAEEERKEVEKAKREQAERERVEKIQAAIIELRAFPIMAVGKSSVEIGQAMDDLQARWIADQDLYAEFIREAETEKVAAVSKLHELLQRAAAHEAALEQARKDREELNRLKQEQEERHLMEQNRIREAAAREAAEIKARAEADAKRLAEIEAQERASRERIEAQERAARLARETAAREARERLAATEAEILARQEAEDKRLAAERERLAEEARAIEEAARTQREAAETEARRQREVAEAEERAEREEQEAIERAARERAQREQEAREASEREIQRQQAETADFKEMCLLMKERFGHREDALPIIRAIEVYLKREKKAREAA